MTPVPASPDGDDVSIDVRLVVAPIAGAFRPVSDLDLAAARARVDVGTLLGHVVGPGHDEPVASFCDGHLVRLIAEPGQRLRPDQPIAWLRAGHQLDPGPGPAS
jgi:hypothetical protein